MTAGFTSLAWFALVLAAIPATLWLLKRPPLGGAGSGGLGTGAAAGSGSSGGGASGSGGSGASTSSSSVGPASASSSSVSSTASTGGGGGTGPGEAVCGSDLSYGDDVVDGCVSANCCDTFNPCVDDADRRATAVWRTRSSPRTTHAAAPAARSPSAAPTFP